MKAALQLNLLGAVQIKYEGRELSKRLLSKSQALLIYLALQERPVTRSRLATLLWGDKNEVDARRNLRVNLTPLRRRFEPYLIITNKRLGFNHHNDYWLDVARLHQAATICENDLSVNDFSLLQTAVDLYQGEFLADFAVKDAPEFEEWVAMMQSQINRQLTLILETVVDYNIANQDVGNGMLNVAKLLQINEFGEKGYRQLMQLLAMKGQRTDALNQYKRLCKLLDRELGVAPDAATVALVAAIRDGQIPTIKTHQPQITVPPPPAPVFQAPVLVPYFVGRSAEIDQLSAQIKTTTSQTRLGIVGLGGAGKTTLAIYLAHALRQQFPDGVLWANATTSNALAIAESWGLALGFDFSSMPDLESRTAALRGVLSEKSVLLVLDDLSTAEGEIRRLIPNSPTCTVIITTRLHEVVLALDATRVNLKELATAQALQLMIKVVGRERIEAEKEDALAACGLLQNLPLAVTLASQIVAMSRRRTLAQLVTRLQSETRRLDLSFRDREVRATFNISWHYMQPAEQRLFALCGLFQGRPFTVKALAAVAEIEAQTALGQLDRLVNLSLLDEVGEIHYQQHSLLADYASEKLAHDEAAEQRMIDYYLAYATAHQHDYVQLRSAWPNIDAALALCERRRYWQRLLRFTELLHEVWFKRGRFAQAQVAYQFASRAAMALEDDAILAHCWLQTGIAQLEQNMYDKARRCFHDSAKLFDEVEDEPGQAEAYYQLARVALEENRSLEALDYLQHCQQLREKQQDMRGLAQVLYRKARVFMVHGPDFAKGQQLAETAVSMQADLGDLAGEIATLRLLAEIAFYQNEPDTALAYAQKALAGAEKCADQGEQAAALYTMAIAHRKLGNPQQSLMLGRQSRALFQKMGSQRWLAMVYYQLSISHAALAEFDKALAMAKKSLGCYEFVPGDELGRAFTLTQLCEIYQKRAEPAAANAAWQEAYAIAERLQRQSLIEYLQDLR